MAAGDAAVDVRLVHHHPLEVLPEGLGPLLGVAGEDVVVQAIRVGQDELRLLGTDHLAFALGRVPVTHAHRDVRHPSQSLQRRPGESSALRQSFGGVHETAKLRQLVVGKRLERKRIIARDDRRSPSRDMSGMAYVKDLPDAVGVATTTDLLSCSAACTASF